MPKDHRMVGIVDCLQYKVLLILWQLSHTKQRTNIYNSTDPKVIYLIRTSSHFHVILVVTFTLIISTIYSPQALSIQSIMPANEQPPSTHPDQISHGYIVFLSVGGVFTFLITVCVLMRFLARRLAMGFWWDDWTILAAFIFAYGFMINTTLSATVGGAGYHIYEYSSDQLEKYLKVR